MDSFFSVPDVSKQVDSFLKGKGEFLVEYSVEDQLARGWLLKQLAYLRATSCGPLSSDEAFAEVIL